MKALLLIDANSIIHRSFHAIQAALTTPDGRPINAVYGLASILLKLWREDRPDYAAALFDRPEPTFREKEYAGYKAQRPVTPDNLVSQIAEAHNLFSAFGIKTFEKPGYEADDLIATLATKFSGKEDAKAVILTGDLDTLQLVENGKILVRTFKKGVSETMTYDEEAVRERYGLTPRQLIDYKALVGDPSDNIKGVPGVGPKTAVELLGRFGTLVGIYENLSSDEKLEKRLGPFRKEAELSKKLVTLDKNAPVEIDNIGNLKIEDSPPNGARLAEGGDVAIKEYFRKVGFETLLKRFESGVKSGAEKHAKIQGRIL